MLAHEVLVVLASSGVMRYEYLHTRRLGGL
jgi:hypothetical protein